MEKEHYSLLPEFSHSKQLGVSNLLPDMLDERLNRLKIDVLDCVESVGSNRSMIGSIFGESTSYNLRSRF